MIKGQLNRDGIEYEKGWNKKNLAYFKSVNPHIANYVEIIEVLNQQTTHIDGEIRKVAHNKLLAVLLRTVPGIAEFSSLMILGEIGDVTRFKTLKAPGKLRWIMPWYPSIRCKDALYKIKPATRG